MSVKQDRGYARTAQDIERKYSFGKKFSEVLGIADDTRKDVDKAVSKLRGEVETATRLARDAESLVFEVIENGVDRVETTTGYRLDSEGLKISRSGEEMSNLLDNTGMYVKRGSDEILTANNEGVNAVNLHAKTYLIVGEGEGRSRFEDYGSDRTGCYWIGG